MKVVSIRENIRYESSLISFLQSSWLEVAPEIYQDCVSHSIKSTSILPQWYALIEEDEIIGCAGLIPNDFISRMDLFPWLVALFVEEEYRGHSYASLLIDRAKNDAIKLGFENLYLCTDLVGYYEKLGFSYIGDGYHPWELQSRIYQIHL